MMDEREPARPDAGQSWLEANQLYLAAQLQRVRLLLRRRVAWLRRAWQNDPLTDYRSQVISDAEADRLLAGMERSAEALFYAEDPEMQVLAQELAACEAALAEQEQALIAAHTPPALAVLQHLFGLTPFERDVILLSAAPALDPAFGRLYAYVQDDPAARCPTMHLALALCGGQGSERQEAEQSFLPGAPLRRYGLLARSPAGEETALHVDQRLVTFVQGSNLADERVASLLRWVPPAPVTPSQEKLAGQLVAWARAGGGVLRPVNLIGTAGAGVRAVAGALCRALGLDLYRLEGEQLPPPGPELAELARLLEREAVLLHMALYLEPDAVDRLARPATAAALAYLVETLGAFFVVGSQERWGAERELLALRVPRPEAQEQRGLWQQALNGAGPGLGETLDAVVEQFNFGPEMIVQAVGAARRLAALRAGQGTPAILHQDLWQACRDLAASQLGDLAQRITPAFTWDDIVLTEDGLRQLHEIAVQVAYRTRVYEGWGFGAKLNRARGISALFAGPTGTGKTMAAEILANHLSLDLYRIDLASVVSKYIGETEKNLKRVFDAAEQSGAILFFDEADALFGRRTEVKDSHDRYANIEINYLLQRMEDYRGLAILATNRKTDLDRAFLRRLRFLVDFPFPNMDARREIWQKVFPTEAQIGDLDYDFLARLEVAGGNARNIALNAAFLAAGQGAPIGMDQVLQAARREYAKIDKMVTETEFGRYYAQVQGK